MLEYTERFDVRTFQFWGGAKDRVESLDWEQLGVLGEHICEAFLSADITPTATQINDFVWFECDDFLEELEKRAREDDEDDEDEE